MLRTLIYHFFFFLSFDAQNSIHNFNSQVYLYNYVDDDMCT
jgi:hypothetical protein